MEAIVFRAALLDEAVTRFLAAAARRYRLAALVGPDDAGVTPARLEQLGPEVVSIETGPDGLEGRMEALGSAASRLGLPSGLCLYLASSAAEAATARAAGFVAVPTTAGPTLASVRDALGMVEHDYRAAGGVVIDGPEVLVLWRESRGEWRLPKGHIEPGEGDLEAALREVAEESGYDDLTAEADLGCRQLDVDGFADGGPGHHVVREEHYFRLRPLTRRQRRRHADELKFDPRWLPVDEALHLLTYEFERDWLATALRARS
ncbi:MAG TPA: NUDIX domain-containing protein [Acidimicrobiales bacterium]|nr:NUDIX domain-containing protein [Acidimicrobiales bacterium]